MFWIVESTNRGHNASSGGRCSFVPGDLLYLLFVDRNWTHPHQPRARYAAMSLSIMTPSPHLFPSSSPQSRSSCCLCSAAAVKQPQPVDELPNSRILKLFCPIAVARGSTAYPSNLCLYSLLYGPLHQYVMLLLFCLLQMWDQWTEA